MNGSVRDAKLRQANWVPASSPKPAGDAQAVAASDQHRVFAPLRQETDQPPRDGLDIARSLAVEDPQLAACIRSPRVIEIQHERNRSLIAPLRLIHVARIAGAGPIPGIVQFEVVQAQISAAVQIEPQLFEIVQQLLLGFV